MTPSLSCLMICSLRKNYIISVNSVYKFEKWLYLRIKQLFRRSVLFCPVDVSILIIWVSPFPVLRVCGEYFHFYCILHKNSYKQTLFTPTRRRVLHCLHNVPKTDFEPKMELKRTLQKLIGSFLMNTVGLCYLKH